MSLSFRFGWNVVCVDKNEEIINTLNKGIPTIYEPSLDDFLERNLRYRRVSFTTDMKKTVEDCDVIFIAVGTPECEDGSADLSNVFEVVRDIGRYMNGYKIIVDKSTVPVGTGREVKRILREELDKRNENIDFDVVSNPEFLRQGSAIQDFTHADRVVIGRNRISLLRL